MISGWISKVRRNKSKQNRFFEFSETKIDGLDLEPMQPTFFLDAEGLREREERVKKIESALEAARKERGVLLISRDDRKEDFDN